MKSRRYVIRLINRPKAFSTAVCKIELEILKTDTIQSVKEDRNEPEQTKIELNER